MTPSLFGDSSKPLAKVKERKPHPLAPWFDAIAEVIGPTAAKVAGGRVARIAKQMKDAGLPPERVAEIGAVVQKWAAWRKVLNLDTLQACWTWILEPPVEVDAKPDSLAMMNAAIAANGGTAPL